MGCHLRWHFPVGCPLRGSRGEYKKTIGTSVQPKQLRKKKFFLSCSFGLRLQKGRGAYLYSVEDMKFNLACRILYVFPKGRILASWNIGAVH
jgi:hypothetical protein